MCGIAGILNGHHAPPCEVEQLLQMVSMLQHRGPDGYGFYRDRSIGLAHSRLSIVDIAGSDQPLAYANERYWITFNGEVFNYIELRESLRAKGYTFKTEGDAEVILACYDYYGDQAWLKLNGQYAFALWDKQQQRLHLVRDRFGILPLFYGQSPQGQILFGSEIKSLFASGLLSPTLSTQGLGQVFSAWSAQAPQTPFEGIHSVRPGHVMQIDQQMKCTQHCYWSPTYAIAEDSQTLSDRAISKRFEEILNTSIQRRLRADVPIGTYLSGGLDSSVITALLGQQVTSPLQSFAVGFNNPLYDERPQQHEMAALLKTLHHEVVCDEQRLADTLPDVLWHCETPLTRMSPVPLYLLSALVRESGMKVVMSGEGADELLGGYNLFKENKIRRFWAREPESMARPRLLQKLYPYITKKQGSDLFWQQFFKQGFLATEHPAYSHLIRWQNTAWMWRFLHPDRLSQLNQEHVFERLIAPFEPLAIDPTHRAQQIEMGAFMSSYLLPFQGDRVAMANSVEVRYPFLDPDLVTFCMQLPSQRYLQGLRDKRPLRLLAARLLPPTYAQRPKQPYRAPIIQALIQSDGMADWIDQLAMGSSDIWNTSAVSKLFSRAKRLQGQIGEREEMALMGIFSTGILRQQFYDDFSGRLKKAREALTLRSCTVQRDELQ